MRRGLALAAGGVALAGAALLRFLRGRSAGPAVDRELDPRAQELRRKLAEAQAVVGDREEFESAQTSVDEAVAGPVPPTKVEERRREVHTRGREAIDHMAPSSERGDSE